MIYKMQFSGEEKKQEQIKDIFEEVSKSDRPAAERRQIEVEKEVESRVEKITGQEKEDTKEKEIHEKPGTGSSVVSASSPAISSETYQKIENILEQNINELYQQMTETQKRVFKTEGERAAKNIELLINQTKVKVKRILQVIKNWLRLIPGINKYFLEQEAKIKTDKIIALAKRSIK